ncbi:GNAT family N-acetyltransferase [Streptacidiphilus monticola]
MTDFQWRSIELADIESWLTLLEAIEAVDQEHEHYSVDQLREWLTDPDIDRERGTVGVWDGDRMVGYARLRCRSAATDEHLMFAQGAVHPEYRGRGLGGALLRWQEEHAPALHRARYPELPLKLYGASKQGQEDSTALYKAYGFEVGRWFFDMVCDLTTAQLPGDQLPEGSPACRSPRSAAPTGWRCATTPFVTTGAPPRPRRRVGSTAPPVPPPGPN